MLIRCLSFLRRRWSSPSRLSWAFVGMFRKVLSDCFRKQYPLQQIL